MLIGVVGLSRGSLNNLLDKVSVPTSILSLSSIGEPVDTIMRQYVVDRDIEYADGIYITETALNYYDNITDEQRKCFDVLIDYSFLDYLIFISDGDAARCVDSIDNVMTKLDLISFLEVVYDESV